MNFNHEQYEAHVAALIRKFQIATAELDERQLAEAFQQALLAGDFQKQVRVTDFSQRVDYIPFAYSERLHSEIARLKALLDQHGIDWSPEA